MEWIEIEEQGVIQVDRIVAIALYESAPIRRMIGGLDAERVIVLTSGKRRSAVLILDSGHVAITALTPHEIWQRLSRISGSKGWFDETIRRPSGGK